MSLPLCAWVLWGVLESNYDVEKVVHIEDVTDGAIDGMALPPGHVVGEHLNDSSLKKTPVVNEGSATSD